MNCYTVNGSAPSSQARRQGSSLTVELGGHGNPGPLVIWRRRALPRRQNGCSCAVILLLPGDLFANEDLHIPDLRVSLFDHLAGSV